MNVFETTYRENYRRMFCIAKKMVEDEDVVKDIIQEVFIYYYERSEKGKAISDIQNWLLRATVNKCIDHINRKKRHVELTVANHLEGEQSEQIEKTQSKNVLRKALSELKPIEMKLAVLYSEGFSYKEIAELADINYASVGKTLSRTLQKLKQILNKLNYEMY